MSKFAYETALLTPFASTIELYAMEVEKAVTDGHVGCFDEDSITAGLDLLSL